MAIVLGNRVKKRGRDPRSEFADNGQIEGQFSKQQIDDLSFTTPHGARLPATINYIEERTVGAFARHLTPSSREFIAAVARHVSRHGLHADLLSRIGHQCGPGFVSKPCDPAGFHGIQSRNTYACRA